MEVIVPSTDLSQLNVIDVDVNKILFDDYGMKDIIVVYLASFEFTMSHNEHPTIDENIIKNNIYITTLYIDTYPMKFQEIASNSIRETIVVRNLLEDKYNPDKINRRT